ncbi:dTMP kinase [soil metagenome]
MFISLEGIDRSGKTTQAALLARALGAETLLLREPGGTPAGERIRAILKDPEIELGALAELLLFSAARADLVREVIEPARAAGRDVVCDRFVDSTAAYQGAARGIGLDVVEPLSGLVAGSCMPDLTVLVRVDPDLAAARGAGRLDLGEADGADRFEAAGLDFQRAVAAAYDELAARETDRIVVVDGEGEPEEVHRRVMAAVAER